MTPKNTSSESHTARNSGVDRRSFLRATGLAAAAAAVAPSVAYGGRSRNNPRNVIFMVSDGMSQGTMTLADMVTKHRTGQHSAWTELLQTEGVKRALMTTHSADRWVTDSAAGGCAWSLGTKVNNGSVNFLPDGTQMSPMHVRAKAVGLATGLVTTTRVTHATPASFIANVPRRDLEDGIAAQTMERGVDVVMGGGARHFPESLRAQHPEVQYHTTLPDLRGAEAGSRHLGLFSNSHLPYAQDRDESIPSLGEMTMQSLHLLGKNPNGFVLQVEGGRVDHAAHSNDACSLVLEQIEYDEALRAAVEYTLGRTDTLLVTTTDHGNANPGLTLYEEQGSGVLDRLTGANQSFEAVSRGLREAAESNTLADVVHHMSGGYVMNDEELAFLRGGLLDAHRTNGFLAQARSTTSMLGSMLSNYHGVAFLSPNHTADMVEVAAIGPGAERLQPVVDNTDLHALVQQVVGIPDPAPMG